MLSWLYGTAIGVMQASEDGHSTDRSLARSIGASPAATWGSDA